MIYDHKKQSYEKPATDIIVFSSDDVIANSLENEFVIIIVDP